MLWKKMIRDIKSNKGTYIASIIIMTIGLMSFTMFSLVLDNLKFSQDQFYSDQNFADGFAEITALPFSEERKLQSLKGIKEIQGRMVQDVQVTSTDEDGVFLRLVSVNLEEKTLINDLLLDQGMPLKSGENNIWIDNNFYAANNLNLNDEVEIIASGKKTNINIVGVGMSPEFVYALRTSSELYPSPESFGIAFVPLETMQILFPQDSYNDLVFTLENGVHFDDVKDKLEYELKAFGLKSLISRDDQVSNLLLTSEIEGLEAMSKAMPLLFILIAVMILYITIKRMIEQQRGQIGILKAFGYTQREIILHYLSYAVIIGFLGSLLGGLLGTFLSFPLTSFYLVFFNMPNLAGEISFSYLLIGMLISLIFSLGAGFQGAKKVLSLEAAEAMRAPAPIWGAKVWIEKISPFWNILTIQGKMAMRNLSRNKGRSVFIFIGIMLCFSISGFTWSMNDLIQKMTFDQFEKVEVYDAKVFLNNPLKQENAKRELLNHPGVNKVEALAEIPVTIENTWHKKETVILGIEEDSRLYNILDKDGGKITPPRDGLFISERLAHLLDVQIASKVDMTSGYLKDDKAVQLKIRGIIPQYVGINAYMELESLQSVLKQGKLATSFMLDVDEGKIESIKEEYRQSTAVSSIEEKDDQLKKLEEMMASYGSLIYLFVLIGVAIGFSIIYSSGLITFSERSRELASMMVLGMTQKEVLSVITFEQWTLSIGAMLAGIPLAKFMLVAIAQSMNNDVFSMPTTISTESYLGAFIITIAAIWLAQQASKRKISKLNLSDVLRASE